MRKTQNLINIYYIVIPNLIYNFLKSSAITMLKKFIVQNCLLKGLINNLMAKLLYHNKKNFKNL